MLTRADQLAALPPARRAQVIYAEAQSALTTRLWRAALGDGERDDSRGAGPLGAGGMRMDSLLGLLGAGDLPGTNTPGTCACGCPCGCSDQPEPVADRQSALGIATPATLARAPVEQAVMGTAALGTEAMGLRLGSNARYAGALTAAEARTGVPATALAAIVDAEAAKGGDGTWNPLSRNPRSSAAGLGQFLSGTWQELAQTPGTWLNGQAAQRGWLDGRGRVSGAHKAEMLALRYDPEASIAAVADLAKLNLDRLEQGGVRVRTDAETLAKSAYLSHHLGLGDARRFLSGGIDGGRARMLLAAQIGTSAAEQRIAAAGNPTQAHREWLLGFIARRIQPNRFSA